MTPVAHPDSCSLEIQGLGTCFGWANSGDHAGLNAHCCQLVQGGLVVLHHMRFWGRDFVSSPSTPNAAGVVS